MHWQIMLVIDAAYIFCYPTKWIASLLHFSFQILDQFWSRPPCLLFSNEHGEKAIQEYMRLVFRYLIRLKHGSRGAAIRVILIM